jgi:catechol 2,3-dioxygenase-like lactoylglutathione lyase family enzyme
MSLRNLPLMYIFLETSQLTKQRDMFERVIGLPIIEVEPHLPHHHHGVLKYDAGDFILSLNLSGASRFPKTGSDAVVTVFGIGPSFSEERMREEQGLMRSYDGGLFTDMQGHHFMFRPAQSGSVPWPVVEELRLTVTDLDASVVYYRDVLGLELVEQTKNGARFATGTVSLLLELGQTSADGRAMLHNTYLIVFYCKDIEERHTAMVKRGLKFISRRVDYNEVGGTLRFDDPSGHRFCLYVPSEVSLTWESGPKVMEIAETTVSPGLVRVTTPQRQDRRHDVVN